MIVPRPRKISTSLFSVKAALVAISCSGLLLGAADRYIAFFSAEQSDYRRLLIDGVGERRVTAGLDSLGAVLVKVHGVAEESYVGRRSYQKGYLIPVHIEVDFPRKNLMTIRVSGTHFLDLVQYQIVESDIHVIDMFKRPLPQESFFREETLSALWPNGRFRPDVTPGYDQPRAAALGTLPVPLQQLGGTVSFRSVIRRAVVWSGSILAGILFTGLPLVWFYQRRRSSSPRGASRDGELPTKDGPPEALGTQVGELMKQNGDLSYDEATLLASMQRDKA